MLDFGICKPAIGVFKRGRGLPKLDFLFAACNRWFQASARVTDACLFHFQVAIGSFKCRQGSPKLDFPFCKFAIDVFTLDDRRRRLNPGGGAASLEFARLEATKETCYDSFS